ncbi:MAG: hypothetical protein AAGA30_18985, partial [Planctomycetota bacterium]
MLEINELESFPINADSTSSTSKIGVDDLVKVSDSTNSKDSQTPSRHLRRRSILAPLIGSSISIAAVLAIVVLSTNFIPQKAPSKQTASVLDSAIKSPMADPPKILVETTFAQSMQKLIDDDNQTIWETPTFGLPLNLQHIPSNPKMVFAVRMADLLDTKYGERTLDSLGPHINSHFEQLLNNVSIQKSEIEQFMLTFHSNNEFEYDSFVRLTLKPSVDSAELPERWPSFSKANNDGGDTFYSTEERCIAVAKPKESDRTILLIANEDLITESLELAGIDVSAGTIRRLAKRTDRERHFNYLTTRTALFNDEGQKWMGSRLASLNRELALRMNNFVRGMTICMHLDEGTYLEFSFDQSVDLKSDELQQEATANIARLNSSVTSYVNSLSDNPYWDSVKSRIRSMLDDLTGNLRVGVEDKVVVGNGWFPNSAGHNFLAAAELLVTFGNSQFINQSAIATKQLPKSLEELLALPRDLTVNTSPDLIVLLNNLEAEILEEFGQLPFEFKIQLAGSDLSKEGITQNQRPSDFEIKAQPLSKILTEIMVKANPDKNISGPNDPNCKMVWVVADLNDNDQPVIL